MIKVELENLKKIEEQDNLKYFGEWINNINEISKIYQNNKPFNYVVIDNFLKEEYCKDISDGIPSDLNKYHKYYNPLEVKYAYDNINSLEGITKDLFYILSSKQIIDVFKNITGIENLEYDKYLHGAGVHLHPKNGRLNIHLDYEKHPILENKERRMNIILYLSEEWKDEWNGSTELWDKDITKCFFKSNVKFNRAILFQTNDLSFHGVPEKISCPDNILRKSFAYYYISPLCSKQNLDKLGANKDGYRLKASFVKRPQDPDLPQLKKLYDIRPYRLINEKDMLEIWPEWNPDIF